MKRILLSLVVISSIAAITIAGTRAFFSDTETSKNNTFQAGAIDLKIDNTSYYNGKINGNTSWDLRDLTIEKFFDFTDVKPNDYGEDTISLHVNTNNAWVCADVKLTSNDDNGLTEPEEEVDQTGGVGEGELADNVNFIWWADDGDNVLESGENLLPGGPLGALDVGETATVTLADSLSSVWGTGPIPGNSTKYIGKAWCFGSITAVPLSQDGQGPLSPRTPANSTGGISCDGSELNNETQTDSLTADVSFRAVQSRNNPNFTCDGEQPSITPTPPVAVTPTPIACNTADVMLVLDRSGSINTTELTQLKTAAKDFVDALGLSTTGIHAGKSSFATTGNLNHHLTDDAVSLKAAIDTMVNGGFTNLKEGIDLAIGEFANPGDGHDRTDLTSPDKMIVITDGHPNRPLPASTADDVAATSADNARAAGAEVFVVGVGGDVNTSYLQTEIADNAAHYFPVSNYSGLETALQNLDLCQ